VHVIESISGNLQFDDSTKAPASLLYLEEIDVILYQYQIIYFERSFICLPLGVVTRK